MRKHILWTENVYQLLWLNNFPLNNKIFHLFNVYDNDFMKMHFRSIIHFRRGLRSGRFQFKLKAVG